MLIYNYQKEFLGIDEADLKALGFKNLLELRSESADFADLFVKTPGFVHNFKHVHWIDFINCAESLEDSKVIIHIKEKNYRCNIKINALYLIDNPSQKAYAINLVNLRVLTAQESDQIAQDVALKPTPKTTTAKTAIFKNQNLDDLPQKAEENLIRPLKTVTHDPFEADTQTVIRVDKYDIPVVTPDKQEKYSSEAQTSKEAKKNLDDFTTHEDTIETFAQEDDFKLDLDMDEDLGFEEKKEEIKKVPKPNSFANISQETIGFEKKYVYNPKVASNELGLPIDLIQEFIEDFIAQANEFKDNLYSSLHGGNMDNVKVLSHKLKGVAANLRVEDAFEALTIVNTSGNFNEIKTNLDRFYIIIAKLSGKTAEQASATIPSAPSNEEEDDNAFTLSFKDEIQDKIEKNEEDATLHTPSELDEDFIIDISDMEDETDDLYMDNTTDIQAKTQETKSPDAIDLELLNFNISEEEVEKEEKETEKAEAIYDKNSVAHEIGIDRENFNALFSDFMDESKDLCALIGNAIAQGDAQTWKKGSIKLKGMSENMRIHSFSKELDTLIDINDADLAQETLDKISAILIKISNT